MGVCMYVYVYRCINLATMHTCWGVRSIKKYEHPLESLFVTLLLFIVSVPTRPPRQGPITFFPCNCSAHCPRILPGQNYPLGLKLFQAGDNIKGWPCI